MNTSRANESLPPRGAGFRELLADALSYWERRRILYNAALVLVTASWVGLTWPHFRPAMTFRSGLLLLVLAAIANACYCAAYPVDWMFQWSPYRTAWKRRRWILLCAGIALAVALASYWIADEIYPSVG